MKTYNEVYEEYSQFRKKFPDDPTPLEEYAKQKDAVLGVRDRAEAYDPGVFRKISSAIDRGFNWTPDRDIIASPAETGATVGKFVGEGFDRLTGTHVAPTVETIGRDTPRMVAEGLLTGPVGWLGRGAKLASLVGKTAGYGSAFSRGVAETDSLAGGAVSAGSLGLGNLLLGAMPQTFPGVGSLAERGVTQFLERNTPDFVAEQGLAAAPKAVRAGLGGVANVGAGVGTVTALNEATRQANLSVLPDEMRTEGDRNPFTQENIAANVAGSAFFLPQLMGSVMRGGPKVSPKQLEQYARGLVEARAQAEGAPVEPVIDAVVGNARTPEQAREALFGILESSRDETVRAKTDGRVEDEARARETFERTYNELVSGRFSSPESVDKVRLQKTVDDFVKFQQPSTPEKFGELAALIKTNLDFLNEGRVQYESELAQRESVLNVNDKKQVAEFERWKAEQARRAQSQAGGEQTWHPQARAAQVIDRLWKSGDLPVLSENWLKSEWNATFDESGNPQFSNEVLAQKLTNYYADRLDAATKAEGLRRKAEIPQSEYTGGKIDAGERAFIDALHNIPKEHLRTVLNRTLEMRGSERVDQRTGQTLSRNREWQKAVIRASQSFDPTTNTILLSSTGKPGEGPQFRRVPITELKTWQPSERRVLVAEGGKPAPTNDKGQQVAEGNIEALKRPSGDQMEIADEEAFKRALAEQSDMPFGQMTDIALDAANRLQEPVVDVSDEGIAQSEIKVAATISDKATTLRKNLSALSDDELWRLAEPHFKFKNQGQRDAKRAGLRLALTAALENAKAGQGNVISDAGKKFLQSQRERGVAQVRGEGDLRDVRLMLRDFFQKSGTTLAEIVKKLASDETVARVKSGGPKAQEGVERPLVQFSGPVRLRKWLADPRGAFTPDSTGAIHTKNLVPLLERLGLTKNELEMYSGLGLDKFLEGKQRVQVPEVVKWMEENTPKVEVRRLEPRAGTPETEQRRAQIQHEVETAGYTIDNTGGDLFIYDKNGDVVSFESVPKEVQTKLNEYAKLTPGEHVDSDAATGRYGVEPKELKDMPGAVDILVRVPYDNRSSSPKGRNEDTGHPLYRGLHFGDSDVNVLASVRGYVETLPSGEKVFHVFEVQSDWGQSVSKRKQQFPDIKSVDKLPTGWSFDDHDGGGYINLLDERGKMMGFGKTKELAVEDYMKDGRKFITGANPDHPLLAVYEQLALKAAIDHARSLGIKKVAVSDAETAMMTEGHDRAASQIDRFRPQFHDDGSVTLRDRYNEIPEKTFSTKDVAYDWMYEQTVKITQEPGMRAAYDERLPRTMEKLTGGKGEVVDFGDHKASVENEGSDVFKDANGDRKRNVTARLYDISSAQPEFAAFGYGKPQIKPGDSVQGTISDDGSQSTFVNPPKPGQFVPDVRRTLGKTFDTLLGRMGYSGTTKQFFTEVATTLALQGDLPNLEFYRIGSEQYGLAGPETGGRARLGLNVDRTITPGEEAKMALGLIQTLGHEIGHLDGFLRDSLITKPDAYSRERERLVRNLDTFGKFLTEDERASMLTVVEEAVPAEFRENLKQEDGRPYGTSNPDEFAQQIRGHVMRMLVFDTPEGRATAKEMLDHAPVEIREWSRDTFRTVRDIMQVMRDGVENYQARLDSGEPSVLTGHTDPFILTRGFEHMLDTARALSTLRYADKAMADTRTWVTNFEKAPNLDMTQSVWYEKSAMPKQVKAQESFPDTPSESAIEAVTIARDFQNGPRALDKAKRPGVVMRTLAPFRQLMWALERDGNKVARPIADAVFQVEAGSHRILSNLLAPFMKRNADGSIRYDAENPLLARIAKERTGPYRDAINKIAVWQRGNHELLIDGKPVVRDAQSMFVRGEKGEIVVNPSIKNAQAAWDQIRARLPRDVQDFVMNQSVVLDELGQRGRDVTLTSIVEANVNRTAVLLQGMNKTMSTEQALGIATQAHDAFLSGNVLPLSGILPPKQIEIIGRLLTGPDGKSGLLNHFLETKEHFENRPGYRSEALPHEWIIRYRTPAGEVKFDSRPKESQAIARARELQALGNRIDGEIVSRKDVQKLSPVDDPDSILTKIAERENFVWNKFVEEMATQHGGAFAEALQSGYTPLETTMREVSARGVGKFTKERKNFIDLDSYDTIDSSLAYAERLAYTVAARSVNHTVGLYLNDPSVRHQPSFQTFVREHMSEFMRPQSQTMKEIKGAATGMMLGANLSSALVNATQSISTLVPVLDLMNGSTGNFVTPWKQLGQAIATATDFTLGHSWKDLAAQTKRIDPSKWTEAQTVAELWRRHVEAGGFTHTVIDDLVFGQDQRLLTNAKFGRGDYGPVSKASLARSGLYLGMQLAMKPFRWAEHGNAKVAFLAGVRLAYEQGLRGDAAYAKAAQIQGLATFGGGRANSPGLQTALSKGFTPGGAGLALALQQYGFGVVAMHGQFVRDALGKSSALSPAEVWHARRAYGTFLMTQTALAGVLGFPLVGAALTALEKVFGIPANQAVRQGLASLSEDDETGAMIAEIGLNGFADYWTGLDISSRVGTSSLLGTSSYRGFNLDDLAGPVGSLIRGGVQSLGYFGQGEPMKAVTALAPTALKKALEMTDSKMKYGDVGIRDKAGNLIYTPTDFQAKAYAFGFRPRELSRRRQLQTSLATSNEITQSRRDRELDQAAQDMLRGDNTRAQRLSQEAMELDPINGSQTTLRAIMDRAIAATTEKDMLATGSRYNAPERSAIYKTFGPDVQHRRSELDLQNLRMQMAVALGDPRVAPTIESYEQAALIDALVSGGSMPRSQAVQMVQMLGM